MRAAAKKKKGRPEIYHIKKKYKGYSIRRPETQTTHGNPLSHFIHTFASDLNYLYYMYITESGRYCTVILSDCPNCQSSNQPPSNHFKWLHLLEEVKDASSF